MNASESSTNLIEVTPSLKVLASVLTVPLCVIGAFGNLAVITAVIKKRSLRTVSNIFTVALMVLSLLVCCHSYPLQVMLDLYFFTTHPWCFVIGSQLFMVSIYISMLLLLTTIERYISICLPLKADIILSHRKVLLTLLCLFLYGGLVGVGIAGLTWIGNADLWRMTKRCDIRFMAPSRYYSLFLISHWLLPIPIMTIMYLHIFIVVRRHIREIAVLLPINTNPTIAATANGDIQTQGRFRIHTVFKKRLRVRLMREAKSAFLLFLVVAVYVINWVPFILFLLTGVLTAEGVSPEQYILLHAFVYSNGTITPYLYGLGNRKLRLTIMSIFLPRNCVRSTDVDETVQTISSRDPAAN